MRRALDDVGHAVELRRLAAVPQTAQRDVFAADLDFEAFRNDRVGAARSREARGFGEAAELDRAFPRAFDFVNAVRDVGLRDEGFIGGVEKNQRLVFPRVVDPDFELFPRERRSRRVVRVAQVNDVGGRGRQRGNEAVFLDAGQVDEAIPAAVGAERSRAARHDVRVHVDGIDRIRHRDAVVRAENVADVPGVAFRAVGDEDFVGGNVDPARAEIVFDDGFAQKGVALFGPVAAEAFGRSRLFRRLAERVDAGFRERARDVADAEADDLRVGPRRLERFDFFRDVGEKVASGQFQIILV